MSSRIILAVVVLGAAALCGCQNWQTLFFEKATLYADTRTTEGDGFTLKSPQWAYDGEPVTFDFQPDPAPTNYVVFYWPDEKTDILTRKDITRTGYRGIGAFKAGPSPRKNTVRAVAYMIRGKCDWFLDKDTNKWEYYRSVTDEPDMIVGEAQMEIIRYRVDIDIPFGGKGRVLKEATLTLLKSDGTNAVRRAAPPGGQGGLEIVGPDAKGVCRARCAPTWKEVNRVGTTHVELLVSFQDGTQEIITREIDTP